MPQRLRPSRLSLVDLKRGDTVTTLAPGMCPAHLVFDPEDPDLFYLSCHNIGIHRGVNVIFGPGELFRVRIREGKLKVESRYSHERFYRITSHVIANIHGRKTIAVTVFPNILEVIDAVTMQGMGRYELYHDEHELSEPPSEVSPDRRSPFSLCEAGDGVLVLNSASTFYVVGFRGGGVMVRAILYNQDDDQAVGGHITRLTKLV